MKLSGLQYNDQREDGTVHAVSVQFSGLIFHIHSRGRFSSEDLDRACEFLHQKVKKQEESNVEKLHLLHGVLRSIKSNDTDSEDMKKCRESTLRDIIHTYFNSKQLDMARFCETHDISVLPFHQEIPSTERQQIEHDVHSLAFKYWHDTRFTGRAIARIFYGLESPLFKRSKFKNSGFWYHHLKFDFNELCQIATKKLEELNRSRSRSSIAKP